MHVVPRAIPASEAALEPAEPTDRLRPTEERLKRLHRALVSVTTADGMGDDAAASLESIARISAEALAIRRVSIWQDHHEGGALDCLAAFDADVSPHHEVTAMFPWGIPRHVCAVCDSEVISEVDGARRARLREMADARRRPKAACAMLAAPVYRKGIVAGVVCFDDGGRLRRWSRDEKIFGLAIANAVSLTLERLERSKVDALAHRQAAALNAATQPISITDSRRRIQWANAAFCRLSGYRLDELVGQDPTVLLRPEDVGEMIPRDVTERLARGESWQGETVNRRKDGTTFVAEHLVAPVRAANDQITHFVSIPVDLTEPRRLEAQFLQAQKMELVGRLAGGVAHDFNNILTVINGTAERLLEDAPMCPLYDDVRRIAESGRRAASLTRQLLAYSRARRIHREPLAIGAELLEFRKMLQRLIGEDIRLDVGVDAGAGHVLADQSQFEQVVLNLAVNAKDAMPHGGTLRIEVRPCEIAETPPGARIALAPGRYVELTMTDTGGGMSADVAARIFEPFFTTKDPNKGTGLGLATVYAIVEQSGGSISVCSQIDRGTTFTIYWPSVGSHDAPLSPDQIGPAPTGVETILVVEDDPAVREFCEISLERHGYRVLTAADGAMAARIAEEFPDPIAMLLTDVVMPDISGHDLASAVTRSRAGIHVLFTSGYTDDALLDHGVSANPAHFLAKPYSGDSLARKVRDVLDHPLPADR